MNDQDYMKLALQLASHTKGQTSPNPMVGSVVVKDGSIVGMGAHLRAGEGHAEVEALKMAGEQAKGATIYVTLEPCSHFGKTPPCANLIIERELARVVVATVDPNPEVAGRGIKRLRDAGLKVDVGICEQEAIELNRMFFHFIQTKRPFVTMKTATTLDGKTATVTGESKWITEEAAREDVHRDRHVHDAILVGIGTVLADDPALTTRLPLGGRNPIRIVLDRHLRLPLTAQMVTDKAAPTWVFTTLESSNEKQKELEQVGITVIRLQAYSIESILIELGQRRVMSLYVEGGQEVNGSFLKEGAVNQVITYIAPKMVGGKLAATAVGGEGIEDMSEAVQFDIVDVSRVGRDLKITSIVKEG
ncbi:bifunctional diaminohydroxyphosphoribosylaminopyrimidine deaminase/5-amino-6-(5-phosphoribosylamino)uracil reductase RibD [Alkalihalophilus lindianensis]|uniref:Riboflavin biosynthesis protein RibD n=1 Tax=Alkalihalophilus lindianensis TaxID=1630542 RepID=A0ABU3X671_9BACI|nr:bifunctional diaminohydroxyphosphoribosylaminopyrimidine deaminase/5-amino-6-(5-phosphoribosylamino)uracil reductase RibD [Alkalihalophilus lindianensis]MDV2683364.1 bifunctional diaminohydroxyphosphoribosylaminopyrimidine deaminase/5-amino-6-(5-phosphoribosylamino)uracil reductase RibD [Alkalihalophilus lindianensis]